MAQARAKATATAPAPATFKGSTDDPRFKDSEDIGGGTLVKWDEAKEIIGTYDGMIELPPYGASKTNSYKATVTQESDGEQVSFFAPAALKSRLDQVKVGQLIRIVYDGTTSPSAQGRPVKNFTVQIASE